MAKALYIAEKPSVAQEFAKALGENMARRDGYMESEASVVTWCVGHLVTMSYPEKYDEKYKKWSFDTLPFLPEKFQYEVIPSVQKQFQIVSGLLNRQDVETIYVCTDSGREGEYIYRLVAQMAHVQGKKQKRVWIDSQTEEEILRGIREARDLSAYDHLADSAYLRAKEDYLRECPEAGPAEVIQYLGQPEEVARTLLDSLDPAELEQARKRERLVQRALVTVLVLAFVAVAAWGIHLWGTPKNVEITETLIIYTDSSEEIS